MTRYDRLPVNDVCSQDVDHVTQTLLLAVFYSSHCTTTRYDRLPKRYVLKLRGTTNRNPNPNPSNVEMCFTYHVGDVCVS